MALKNHIGNVVIGASVTVIVAFGIYAWLKW